MRASRLQTSACRHYSIFPAACSTTSRVNLPFPGQNVHFHYLPLVFLRHRRYDGYDTIEKELSYEIKNEELAVLLKETAAALPDNASPDQVLSTCDFYWQRKSQAMLKALEERLMQVVKRLPKLSGMSDAEQMAIIVQTMESIT